MRHHYLRISALIVLAGLTWSCAIKQRAIQSAMELFSNAQDVYLSDPDPELVEAALPFNLKTLETLLASYPQHQGLLLTASTSFTLYAHAFVEAQADLVESDDYFRAEALRARASKLYRRAKNYGLRALEVRHSGISSRLSQAPDSAVQCLTLEDVPYAVWTAAAWGAAISNTKHDPQMTADIAVVGALLNRCLDLEETFADGFIHELLMSYELGRFGGSVEQARDHYQRALEYSGGEKPSLWLSWALGACVVEQDREQFEVLIDKVLAFDLDSAPSNRLLNTVAQRKAAHLKAHVQDLFL